MKKVIIWKSDTVLIPGAGLAEKGKSIAVDLDAAASFIKQGKAGEPPQPKKSEG